MLTEMTHNSELLMAALDYAGRGWPVFPVHGIHNGACTCGRKDCSSSGKHPLTRRGLHDASTDQDRIRSWWGKWRRANVGIATGQASGIVVVDIDLPAATASIDALNKGAAPLPLTLVARTGGGGLHLLYRCDGRCLSNTSGRLPGHDGELAGIDLRAEGGYIVAPPSRHASGQPYEWVVAGVQPAILACG